MKRSILLVGGETYLGSQLVQRLGDDHHVLLATVHQSDSTLPRSVSWSVGSSLSAKKVILEADRILSPLEELWISPTLWIDQDVARGPSIATIEQALDRSLKGPLFLIKEALSLMEQRSLVIRVFFLGDRKNPPMPLSSLVYEGLGAYLRALIRNVGNPRLRLLVYETQTGTAEGFLDQVFEGLDRETRSGWYTFPRPLLPWRRTTRKRSIQ